MDELKIRKKERVEEDEAGSHHCAQVWTRELGGSYWTIRAAWRLDSWEDLAGGSRAMEKMQLCLRNHQTQRNRETPTRWLLLSPALISRAFNELVKIIWKMNSM